MKEGERESKMGGGGRGSVVEGGKGEEGGRGRGEEGGRKRGREGGKSVCEYLLVPLSTHLQLKLSHTTRIFGKT